MSAVFICKETPTWVSRHNISNWDLWDKSVWCGSKNRSLRKENSSIVTNNKVIVNTVPRSYKELEISRKLLTLTSRFIVRITISQGSGLARVWKIVFVIWIQCNISIICNTAFAQESGGRVCAIQSSTRYECNHLRNFNTTSYRASIVSSWRRFESCSIVGTYLPIV